MAKKFRNKYRIKSARLAHWDYGKNAAYFVTICTKNRVCFFGDVENGQMMLNNIGLIAQKRWLEIPNHFPFVNLGAYVVMPNHVHGIIIINVETPTVETPNLGVSTKKWKPGTLGVIINQYKRAVTIGSRKINAYFGWQPRFHDRIIRNHIAFHNISKYIQNNPGKWA